MVIIGNYLVGAVIGRGKYGWVSQAKHVKLGLDVALKHAPWAIGEQCQGGNSHIDCEHVKESSWKAALKHEASVLEKISHPAIVSLIEVVKGPLDTMFICLEDLGNLSLSNFVNYKGNPGLNENVVRSMLKPLSEGLAHLHNVGILHRDIKPDNVMVVKLKYTISAKLIDLGLAASCNPDKILNTSDARVGTVAYMAPELMIENNRYDSKVDIFSLGATLFYSLIGNDPFIEFSRNGIRSTTSIFGLQVNHEDALNSISTHVASLIRSMLIIDPIKRCTVIMLLKSVW